MADKNNSEEVIHFQLWLIAILIAACLVVSVATAFPHDFMHPDQDEWYASLRQPDNPVASCCGGKDAYWTDKTDECGPGDFIPELYGGCAVVAIITDTRDIPGRHQFAPGTRIPIPASKIRKPASANPTEHGVVFVGPQRQVYCYEPLPLT